MLANLLRYDGASVGGLQSRHQLGHGPALLLWVQVADLLQHVDLIGEHLVMALLWTFFKGAASSTDLNREFLATGVSNKLAGLLLDVLGRAG